MAIHHPMLYLGYVGFAVPFAFAIGSLITRQPGEGWIHTTRRWTLVTWLFQSTGIMLGAAWAYHVLGWGGYWGWDPVENASLLPWLSGTAFLHSVMMQEKKGMMKIWNIVLVSATFFLCILGTLLTRSGVVQSVHAFARSDRGKYFAGFLAVGIAAVVFLILDRLDYLKSEALLVGALIAGGVRHFYAVISFGFCLFVALTIVIEFYKGARAIAAKSDMNLMRAVVELTHRNTRRYGGYLVHMGIVLAFIGFTGHAFNQNEVKELNQGDSMSIGHYKLQMVKLAQGENANYQWHRATLQVTKAGQ